MISFFFTFLVLYVLTGILRPIGLEPVVLIGIRAAFLGALTFGLLWKFLGAPAGRSLVFAAIVIFVSEAPFFMIFVWPYGPG